MSTYGELIVDEVVYPLDRPDLWPSEFTMRDEIAAVVQAWRHNEPMRISTSGSTGTPKVIVHPFDNIVRSAKATASYFVLPERSNVLLCLPVSKIAGRMQVYRALINNWRLWVVEPSSIPLKKINQTLDFAAMTPFQAQSTLNENPTEFRKIRSLLLGGAHVSKPLMHGLKAAGVHGWEGYGMTETLTHVAVRKVSPESEAFFRCLPGIHAEIGPNDALVLHGDRFASPLLTTDRVSWMDEKRFLWLGRTDFTLNTGGIKVQPEQIEARLEESIDRAFLIAGEPDELLGTRIVIVVEGAPFSPEDEHALMAAMEARLEKFERPKSVKYLPQLPRTENGKIERHRL